MTLKLYREWDWDRSKAKVWAQVQVAVRKHPHIMQVKFVPLSVHLPFKLFMNKQLFYEENMIVPS